MGLLNKFRLDRDKRSLDKEVVEHLIALLNTKQEFGAWQKGFGMGSYSNGKSRTDIINEVIADLKYNIETYEKRIRLVTIDVIDSDNIFNLRFQITCQLGERFHSYYIGFKKNPSTIEIEEVS